MTQVANRIRSIPRLKQLLRQEDGWVGILRPAAFFWTAGRLYVGYSLLSTLHHDEPPLWDPQPVKLGTIIETRAGFYQFTGILREGEPYRRQYAQLQFAYFYRPDDFGDGFLRKQIDQGSIAVHEKYVLAPNTYMEAQWLSTALLHKSWRNGRNLERQIQRSEPVSGMRKGNRKLRSDLETQFSDIEDRERMIAQFAAQPGA